MRTMFNAFRRANASDYRAKITSVPFAHTTSFRDVALILYGVTTLYLEAENEDALRKVGYSKERRVDAQIVADLLVDRTGFPLEIDMFEGNKGKTHILIPAIGAFKKRGGVENTLVVADAGMRSATNLRPLDSAGFGFNGAARRTTAPLNFEANFLWHSNSFTDRQIIDTATPLQQAGTKPSRSEASPCGTPMYIRGS